MNFITVNKKYRDYLILILAAIITYWPVSLMIYSLKNDAINYFLAVRYNSSGSIQHGIFPFWSPYINMGYPLHGDIQSGVWNPVVFLLSLFRKYDIYWLHFETILTIITGGIGIYNLLTYFKLNQKVVLAVSVAYMMNGYTTDSGQFLNWLYAAAFLPFVMLTFFKCFTEFNLKGALGLGLSSSLMFLCAYPADFILTFYLIFTLVITSFVRFKKNSNSHIAFKKYLIQIVLSSLTFIIICLPAIVSYWPFIHSIERGSGVDLETSLQNTLAPANLISFLVPWATMKGAAFQITDPLIRNCYAGIISLIFFIYFIIRKRSYSFYEKIFIGIFIFFLLFSLGKIGGLRILTFYTLPLMNMFRHPANAKLFFIFAIQILSAFALDNYTSDSQTAKPHLKKIVSFLLVIACIGFFIGMFENSILRTVNTLTPVINSSLGIKIKQIRESFSFYDWLLLNSFFLLLFLLIVHLLIKKDLLKKYFFPLLFSEMFITAQGMLPLTYVSTTTPKETQKILNSQPEGYPLPDLEESISANSADGMKYFSQVGCLNVFNKKVGRSDYPISPANLNWQESFWDSAAFRKKIIQYPLFYLADTIYKIADTSKFILSASSKKAAITDLSLDPEIFISIPKKQGVTINKFIPGFADISTNQSRPSFLVFLQNDYYNWQVYVNGKQGKIILTDIAFMGVILPPGQNKVQFIYNTRYLKWLGLTSALFFIIALIYLSLKSKR